MKISQEAREAAEAVCDFFDVAYVNAPYDIMQSLINSTLEKAAGVAEGEAWGERQVQASQRDGDDGPSWYNEAIDDAAAAIRKLMESE